MRFAVLLLCAWSASAQSSYRIETFAGTAYGGDGKLATLAPLLQPQGMAVDRDGTVIFADAADHRIRRITTAGLIQTIAGDGIPGFSGDGLPGAAARLETPYGVAFGPNREIYIADLGNHRVRVVGVDGVIRTFAGGGETEPSSESAIKATTAKLVQPRNVAVDAGGAVYISDFGAHRIYRVGSDGMLSVVAGTGVAGDSEADGPAKKCKLSGPAGLVFDAFSALFVADSGNHRVRKIANGLMETITDGNKSKLDFGAVTSIALDKNGRIHAAGGNRIPLVTQNGSVSYIETPADEVFIDASGRLLTVAYRQVRTYFTNSVKVLAGNGVGAFAGDGGGPDEWRFQRPAGITRDAAGNLYIADAGNGRVRRLSSDGKLSTVTAGLGQPAWFAFDRSGSLYFTDSKAGIVYRMDTSGRVQLFSRGNGANPFRSPSGLAFDARGDLIVADTGNHLIRKVTPDGFVSTVAGGGSSKSDGFGPGVALTAPTGVVMTPEGDLYFTETTRVRKLSVDGRVTTVPGISLTEGKGIGFDLKNRLLVADAGAKKIYRDTESFSFPEVLDTPTGILAERDGSILVSDSANHRIFRLVPGSETSAVAPPAELKLGSFRTIHPGTMKSGPVAPGQLVYLDWDETPPSGTLEVQFGSEQARILGVEGSRMTTVVPTSAPLGTAEVSISDSAGKRAVGSAEIVMLAPVIVGAIANESGTRNDLDNPAPRGSIVTLFVAGEGNSADLTVAAEIAGISATIVSAERTPDRPGLMKISLQVPGGYLPSGMHPLQLWINGVRISEATNVVCQ